MAIIKNPLTIVNTSGGAQVSNKLVDVIEDEFGNVNLTAEDLAGLTSVAQNSFYCNWSLQSIVLPEGVTEIRDYAFYQCEYLETIVIPSTINAISDFVLYNCEALTGITILATTPPSIGMEAFAYGSECPIYVPSGSVSDYQSEWSSLASRIEAIPSD